MHGFANDVAGISGKEIFACHATEKAKTEDNPYTGACASMRNRAVMGPLDSDAPAKAIAPMRAETRAIDDEATRGTGGPGTCEPGAGEEPLRLADWMQRTRRRLDAQRVRIAALHREWEQTEVDAPGELRALVRLSEAQAAYVTTLRLDHQLRLSVAGDGMRCRPAGFSHPPRSFDGEEA
jgi:hypothetical protein